LCNGGYREEAGGGKYLLKEDMQVLSDEQKQDGEGNDQACITSYSACKFCLCGMLGREYGKHEGGGVRGGKGGVSTLGKVAKFG